jgi:DnaJ-class molecular chaperone
MTTIDRVGPSAIAVNRAADSFQMDRLAAKSLSVCPACDGTGLQKLKRPTEPGRKIYSATCKKCLGKGRIRKRS